MVLFLPPTATLLELTPPAHTPPPPQSFFIFFNFTNREELLAYVNALQAQVERQQSDTKQVLEERMESCSDTIDLLPLTKHVDLSDENVDKACLSDSRSISVSRDGVVQLDVDQVHPRSIGDGEWSDVQATDSRISDVREIMPEATGTSLDILVITLPVDDHREHDRNSFHQP
ncbi:hypothetical protein IFM89_036456 [Coptis chinensis]|uniref:Uncharacterized protein n=1 Tax=Coptis chinensis TaxID=261450 RepID=A0A835IZF6_9MAGN|nr:hypothetical protein IFM89_036456 [Coptis chinensis]